MQKKVNRILPISNTDKEKNYYVFLQNYNRLKRAKISILVYFLTSLLVFFTLLFVASWFSLFYLHVPLLAKNSLEKISSSMIYVIKEENPSVTLETSQPCVQKQQLSIQPNSSSDRPKRACIKKAVLRYLPSADKSRKFSARMDEFLGNSSCKIQFFMTWISSLQSFGDREMFSMESLFKAHPNACLVIVSSSMDSTQGIQILRPFLEKGIRIMAVTPDFDYLFKNTPAESWFHSLKLGNIEPGEISLGQNLSNLLRLSLLYKYGGVYMDADVIVLKSFSKLRNAIGAQSADIQTGNWNRLNNAILIFDKNHPVLFKFIEEFAKTFDGNKWGHNGPYMVSRVVSRLSGKPGYSFTVMPPSAFYPVDWITIQRLFQGPRDKIHSKWLHAKLVQIQRQSYALHLWNRESRKLKVERGSIISQIMSDCCIFCTRNLVKHGVHRPSYFKGQKKI